MEILSEKEIDDAKFVISEVDITKLSFAVLTFNGKRICWIEQGKVLSCWSAVSGKTGNQSKTDQDKKNIGPIPEGIYGLKQKDYQSISDISTADRIFGTMGRGSWPGLEVAWGKHRIWLTPKSNVGLFGRSGFSIHGGLIPGSAGCIDLSSNMEKFVKKFLSYGKDMDLIVKYQ